MLRSLRQTVAMAYLVIVTVIGVLALYLNYTANPLDLAMLSGLIAPTLVIAAILSVLVALLAVVDK